MSNRQTQPRRTSGRINQIALVRCIIGTAYYACTLIRQVLFADPLELSQYSRSNFTTLIDLLTTLVGLMLLARIAIRKRYWFLSVAATLLGGSLILVGLDVWVVFDQRTIVELFITLFRTAAYFTALIGLLHHERLSDVI